MPRKLLLALPLILTLPAAVSAETVARTAFVPEAGKSGGEVRVQVHMNFIVPGPADDSEESFKVQEQARRRLYESAARECEVLRASIASDCRVESISVNISRHSRGQFSEGFNVSGNFSFRVTLK
jgi:hypothetical protein